MSVSRTVEIAEHAGFCFGVKRAAQALEDAVKNLPSGGAVCTLGPLIHNESYIRSLESRGIFSVNEEEAVKRAEEASATHPFVLIIRAHGILIETEKKLHRIAAQNPHFTLVDATCPFVKKIQKIAEDCDPKSDIFFFSVTSRNFYPQFHKQILQIFSIKKRVPFIICCVVKIITTSFVQV